MNAVLPAQIRAQIAEAEALSKQLSTAAEPSAETPTTPEAPTEAAVQPQPADPVPAVAPPSNPPVADWEHRYNSMKGRHDALSAELARAQAEITTLREQLNKKPAPQSARVAPTPAELELTEQERKDYGEDFVRVIEKRARAALLQEMAELRAQQEAISRKLDGVATNTQVDARTRMISTLDAMPFDWREVNASDGWKAWLEQQDHLSGVRRQDLLMRAWEANDAVRMRRFFEGYLSESASAAPPAGQSNQGAATAAPAVDLASLAAPGSARSGAATAALPQDKPIITQAQIGRFYSDVTSGKFKGREAEKKALERQIESAVAEGRVRG